MANLNGNAVPSLLNAPTLAVKWAGTVLGVAASSTFGPEAPMVHLGACVANLAVTSVCCACAGGFLV